MSPPDRALWITGTRGDTRRYRVTHAREALELTGWSVRVLRLDARWPPPDVVAGQTVVLHRVAWSDRVAELIDHLQRHDVHLVYETDDLVFQPDAAARLAHLRTVESRRGGRHGGGSELRDPEAYLRTLRACHGALVATEPLASAIREIGRPAVVWRNAIDLEMLRLSTRAWRDRLALRMAERSAGDTDRPDAAEPATRASGGPRRTVQGASQRPIVVGYASGTATHDVDFREAGPALRRIMRDDPRVRLRIVGPLRLGAAWDGLDDRVQRVDFMDWRRLPEALADLDVNLAPLEPGDRFSAAKSELKFFEAGAVGVPTVASATSAFVAAITDGHDGVLARDAAGWERALRGLIDDPDRRHRMGNAARDTVVARYVTDVRGPEIVAALESLRRPSQHRESQHRESQHPASQHRESPRREPLLRNPSDRPPAPRENGERPEPDPVPEPVPVPEPEPEPTDDQEHRTGSGACCTELIAPAVPDAWSRAVRLAVERLEAEEQEEEAAQRPRRVVADASALAAIDAQDREALRDETTATLLTLQDAPALAYHAMGAEFVTAERACASGMPAVTLGPWLAAWLRARHRTPIAGIAPPPVDLRVFVPGLAADDRSPRVVLDLSDCPDISTWSTGLAALEIAASILPSIEPVVMWSSIPPDGAQAAALRAARISPRDATDPAERVRLLRTAAALLVPSMTNPATTVAEAMACGCPVVAPTAAPLDWLLVDGVHGLRVEAHPDAMGAAVAGLLGDPSARQRMADACLASVERSTLRRASEALRHAIAHAEIGPAVEASGHRPTSVIPRPSGPDRRAEAQQHPDGWTIDLLQPLVDDGGQPLGGPHRPLAFSFTPRRGGLCGVDVRIRSRGGAVGPDGVVLDLRIYRGPFPPRTTDDRPPLRIAHVRVPHGPAEDPTDTAWLALRFPPLQDVAGRRLVAVLDVSDGSGREPGHVDDGATASVATPITILGIETDRWSHGRVTRGGDVVADWTPALRTWCVPQSSDADIRPPSPSGGHGQETHPDLVARIRVLTWRAGDARRARASMESTFPFQAVSWVGLIRRPLPPIEQRPWPVDAGVLRKLWGTLRHFGPAALIREVRSYLRWRRMPGDDGGAGAGSDGQRTR